MAKSSKESLPFEPRKKKKQKKDKQAATNNATNNQTTKSPTTVKKLETNKNKPRKNRNRDANLSAIPDAVSKRMARRMVFLSGIPTAMGIASFFVFYWLFSQNIIEFPPYLVLLVTAGLFGLGFAGLSYSVFSASWDEDREGGVVGFSEFKTNFGRTISAWKNRNE